MECGPLLANLFGLARQVQIGARATRYHQRRVPEGIPFFALDDLGSQRNPELLQWLDLLVGETADAAGELELGRQVLAQDDPFPVILSRSQFLYHRLAGADRERRA